jgi:hypothetical protein
MSDLRKQVEAAILRLEERGLIERDGFIPGGDGGMDIAWRATGDEDFLVLVSKELKRVGTN